MLSFTKSRSRKVRTSYTENTKNLYCLIFILFLTSEIYPQWVQTKEGWITALAVNESNLFAGDTCDIFLSTDNGANWVNCGWTKGIITDLAACGETLFARTFGGACFSTDNGVTWTLIDSISSHKYVTCTAVCPNEMGGVNLFVGINDLWNGENGSLYLSTNNGTDWTPINSGFPTNTVVGTIFISIETGEFILLAGTNNGLYLSQNNGAYWSPINSGLPDNCADAFAVIPNGSGGIILFASFSSDGGIFLSTDNGTNWKQVNSWLTGSYLTEFAVSGSNIFAGTYYGGIFLSTDLGVSWSVVNSGLPLNTPVFSLAVIGSNIIAGTGKGAWCRPLSEMITEVEISSELPTKCILYQNYPNPFNPSTSIEYRVGSIEHVTFKIYDVLGNEVATLVNEEKPAGNYEVAWSAERFSSGVYFYKLQAGTFIQTKKMILLR